MLFTYKKSLMVFSFDQFTRPANIQNSSTVLNNIFPAKLSKQENPVALATLQDSRFLYPLSSDFFGAALILHRIFL